MRVKRDLCACVSARQGPREGVHPILLAGQASSAIIPLLTLVSVQSAMRTPPLSPHSGGSFSATPWALKVALEMPESAQRALCSGAVGDAGRRPRRLTRQPEFCGNSE